MALRVAIFTLEFPPAHSGGLGVHVGGLVEYLRSHGDTADARGDSRRGHCVLDRLAHTAHRLHGAQRNRPSPRRSRAASFRSRAVAPSGCARAAPLRFSIAAVFSIAGFASWYT
jgi:hypothetical protein